MTDELICYCFGHTKTDIEKDVVANKGRSTILEKILTEKKKGTCQCHMKNPKGSDAQVTSAVSWMKR